jgi:fumarylacetoacetase
VSLALNETHDPQLSSWVDSANTADTDFPIQNLPLGRFRRPGESDWRIGSAIGDQVLDLRAAGFAEHADIAALLQSPAERQRALRAALSAALTAGSRERSRLEPCLHALDQVELGLPCDTRDYTDFYVGIHHATAVGKLFRPDNPLLPNYRWVPIGYHGRASTLIASGEPVYRPQGQVMPPGATRPELWATQRLDIELELGVIVGRPNARGEPVPLGDAEDHIAGLTLLNDWSARDVQPWEYQPLGPFLAKNFATTLSPWIVTLEALAPFRRPLQRPAEDPPALPYLDSEANRQRGAFDIALEVWIDTPAMRAAAAPMHCLARSNFADAAYWTIAQLIAHHTVNGCALAAGDVLGTGTLSGPQPEQAGSLLELTQGGQRPIPLPNGETRTFLQDGDRITLRAFASAPGARRIGFGNCTGTIVGSR